jgi:molybdate transport system permease protein
VDTPHGWTVTSAYRKAGSDRGFYVALSVLGGSYLLLVVGLLLGDLLYTNPGQIRAALDDPQIRFAIRLSLLTSTVTAVLSLWVAVPLGYLLSRTNFRGKAIVDTLVDIPIILPPIVIGLSLLILFQLPPGKAIERVIPVTYHIPAIILAQFTAAAAFAIRTMRVTFDQIDPRAEQVALTLGCTRMQAFMRVTLPTARNGLLAAATLAWARSLGEFGPVQVFAGATPGKTVVMPTAVYLEQQVGHLHAAIAVSLVMVAIAVTTLALTRALGLRNSHVV